MGRRGHDRMAVGFTTTDAISTRNSKQIQYYVTFQLNSEIWSHKTGGR
jgi:hypothetical protein